jgi:RNA polymerase sigma-70 factor (ECF subfamily)
MNPPHGARLLRMIPPDRADPPDFARLYAEWLVPVSRWVRALGGPESELDDLTQEVFLVARSKLEKFDGENVAGWLYRIAANTVRGHRKLAWFRHLFHRPRDVALEEHLGTARSPEEILQQKQARRTLERLVARMSRKRRVAFMLFEVEGYSGEEIAALEGIPVATVWTRLHHARRDFLSLLAKHRESEGRAP